MSEYIDIKNENGVLKICLNRADKKNALDVGMYQTLADTLKSSNEDSSVRSIYLYGDGPDFCSGNDLKDFLQNKPEDDNAPVFQFMHALADAKKPIVAAAGGLAIGIGTTMLLHCDFIYADHNTRFKMPFVQLGVCAEAGSSLLIPALFGYQKASDLLLCGDFFSAEDAKNAGFVNEIVEPEKLQQTALARAEMLAKLPPNALVATKGLMKQSMNDQVKQAIKDEAEQFRQLLNSEEAQQIIASFFKR